MFAALAAVEDPRDPRGRRYPLVSILAAAVCAVIAGACTFAAVGDWVRFQDRTVWARLGFCGRDGKVVRGARLGDSRQVHLLSAYDTSTGIVLAQVQITAKSNEIPAFTPLLRLAKTVLGRWTVSWSWPTRCTPRSGTPTCSPSTARI